MEKKRLKVNQNGPFSPKQSSLLKAIFSELPGGPNPPIHHKQLTFNFVHSNIKSKYHLPKSLYIVILPRNFSRIGKLTLSFLKGIS
jgi:hypothetical protein